MGTVLQFKRPAPRLDLSHGSWVVAVTARRWLRVRPEMVYQGTQDECVTRGMLLWAGAALCWSGVVYQIMTVEEFERVR